jgi:hypothetical protein
VNSSRFSGVSSDKALSISLPADSKTRTVLKVKTTKKNKPKQSAAAYPLRRAYKRTQKALATHASGYRSDLQSAALARWARTTSVRKTKKLVIKGKGRRAKK